MSSDTNVLLLVLATQLVQLLLAILILSRLDRGPAGPRGSLFPKQGRVITASDPLDEIGL